MVVIYVMVTVTPLYNTEKIIKDSETNDVI